MNTVELSDRCATMLVMVIVFSTPLTASAADTGARRSDYPVALATPTCHCGLAHSSRAT